MTSMPLTAARVDSLRELADFGSGIVYLGNFRELNSVMGSLFSADLEKDSALIASFDLSFRLPFGRLRCISGATLQCNQACDGMSDCGAAKPDEDTCNFKDYAGPSTCATKRIALNIDPCVSDGRTLK